MPIWSDDKESIAHHEAGHWVMSHIQDCPLATVEIQFDEAEGTWIGSTSSPAKAKDANAEKAILIAFAGPLAEILFQARKKHPGCALDTIDDPEELLQHVLDHFNEDLDCSRYPEIDLFLRILSLS